MIVFSSYSHYTHYIHSVACGLICDLFPFQAILQSSTYSAFLEHAIPRFVQFLRDGKNMSYCTFQVFVEEIKHRQLKSTRICVRHTGVLYVRFPSVCQLYKYDTDQPGLVNNIFIFPLKFA